MGTTTGFTESHLLHQRHRMAALPRRRATRRARASAGGSAPHRWANPLTERRLRSADQLPRWKPAPIISVIALVRAVAPLTRLVRGAVLDQLAAEQRARNSSRGEAGQPSTAGRDWRQLLFPTATDATFADGYAQAVTFALLLACSDRRHRPRGCRRTVRRSKPIAGQHSLMARALQLLTDYVADDFKVTLDLLVRVIGAVDWTAVRGGSRDTYLHLYNASSKSPTPNYANSPAPTTHRGK